MYWTHLIFVLLNGVFLSWSRTAASKPGYLDFDNLPETNFSCDGKVIGGYYADVETGCQMFHVCTIGQKGEVTDIKFLCLNGTVFDQETRVCERIDEVDCSKSEDFFGLNLELYGNNANFGIQPENEFECEDCSTDQTDEDDEYEESEETTTFTSSTTSTTTTTTTTTTTPKPTTTSTTTPRPNSYQTANQETIAALIALHNAFNQGLQGSKLKPAPPRVINNAFSPTKPTIKPYSTYATQRANVNPSFKSHYTADSQSYGSLNLQQRERPYYFTPSTEKSNYHHFHSGDTSFGHSFDVTKPYNYQYFHSRKLPEIKPSISVVTSTSTSTSVKTSKPNATEYPTGYDDYQEDIDDTFFDDVPKLRQKRELHYNHKYDDEVTTIRYKNHKYDDESRNSTNGNKDNTFKTVENVTSRNVEIPTNMTDSSNDKTLLETGNDNDKDQFLQSLLGSIDLDEDVREKITSFFKQEEKEVDDMSNGGVSTTNLGSAVGQVFTQRLNLTLSNANNTKTDKIIEWKKYFDDMKRDISLNFTDDFNLTDSKNNPLIRERRDTRRVGPSRVTNPSSHPEERSQSRGIDTEKFQLETRRARPGKEQVELKPVSEAIQDDFTTLEYRKTSKRVRSQPLTTSSLRMLKFNYEITTAVPASSRRQIKQVRHRPLPSIEARDFVHEEDHPSTTRSRPRVRVVQKHGRATPSIPRQSNERRVLVDKELTTPLPRQTQASEPEEIKSISEQPSYSTSNAQDDYLHERLHSVSQTTPHHVRHTERSPISSTSKEIQYEDYGSTASIPTRRPIQRNRGSVKSRTVADPPLTSSTTPIPRVALTPDPDFDCKGKVKGGFYADIYNDCRAFFICSQGEINGPLLKSHFACGDTTKFNQRSRTCQAEDLVDCSVSPRYYHLNNDFLVPDTEEKLKGSFEPMKVR